ncbi:flagellar filament capping protein FliD [Iodobacter fluviatilis]|uniref:Flagellar hook-associated protein 2 n=1 Tax=Iodobacter fluviatilis TaxID=537 RepID=A0A377Q766_9NEIS|nr:flagellar filament capping protein FliD [Iodobacter fluviatilis]TCU89216.1 flagellar hook-associated protein 2 [Iodobacter fluviatilis]STQ90585.1 Flagellar cap protein [Iodobacter fluviatilis]
MASIASLGSGSGMDLNGLIDKLMTAEKAPLQTLLLKEASYQAKISAYGSVKSALAAFQTSLKGLSSVQTFRSTTATLADSSIATVNSNSLAQPGSYSLEVSQLAQNQKLTSNAFSSINTGLGTGTLTLQFGTVDSHGTDATGDDTFTANAKKAAFSIDITDKNNSLAGVRDAINLANKGVSASILNDGTGSRLVLTSKDSGAENSIKLTVTDSDGNSTDTAGLSALAYDPAGARNLIETQAAKDAKFKIDGINVSKPTNSVSDAIQGLTINLTKVSSPTSTGATTLAPTTITIGADLSGLKDSIKGFIKAYNELNKTLKDVSSYTPGNATTSAKAAPLNGDSAIRAIQNQMRSVVNEMQGEGSYFKSLSDIGVSFTGYQTDAKGTIVGGATPKGDLSLNEAKLQAAISSHPGDVANLFTVNGVASSNQITFLSGSLATQSGKYAIEVTTPATQAKYSGSALSFFKVDSSNNTKNVTLGGVSASLALDNNDYTTESLAAQIKSKIEADSTLFTSGSDTVKVEYNKLNKNFDISRERVIAGAPPTTQKDSMALAISSAPKPITIDDNNKTLMVSVDGVISQPVTLSKGSYATMADLAAEMQSKINSDESLVRGGKTVGVAFNESTSKFDLSSGLYGSASKIKITGVGDAATSTTAATLGIVVGGYSDTPSGPTVGYTYTAGADVEGLIGGEKAKGTGQSLTGTGASEGLSLIVTASTAGDYGSVSFNRGVAFALDKLLDGMVKDRTGLVAKQTDGVNASIAQLGEKRVRMNRQYDATEALYRKQFTAMDIAIATMRNTSSNLTAQLANLPK